MSLRAELHDALDEVTPPAPHLELRITASILDEATNKNVVQLGRDRVRWTRRFRGVVGLVAATLVVVLIGGLVVGGRLLKDLQAPTPTINQAELKRLEALPLLFPVVGPGDACPVSPLTDVSAHSPSAILFGAGPVYSGLLGNDPATTDWGTWTDLNLMVDTTRASGPILIRAMDLKTRLRLEFALFPYHAVGLAGDGIPTGSVDGSDVIQGARQQLHRELVLDTSRPFSGTKKGDWPIFKSYMGYPKAATGCIGLQIIGGTFTESIVLSR